MDECCHVIKIHPYDTEAVGLNLCTAVMSCPALLTPSLVESAACDLAAIEAIKQPVFAPPCEQAYSVRTCRSTCEDLAWYAYPIRTNK